MNAPRSEINATKDEIGCIKRQLIFFFKNNKMAVRRELVYDELVYDERGGFAAADKLTPKKKTTQPKARNERRKTGGRR